MIPIEPSNWELKSVIERNYAETREDIIDLKTQVARDSATYAAQLERYVLTAVYEAQRAAMLERIARLENQAESSRAAIRGAMYAAAASVVASLIVAVVTTVLRTS
ncbi:hypothetical protein [Actinomadura sp. 9N215]|uniref:hypothetical protein n=1 Tax=Actinomadura sp. 9N215 TaxID=3375150 RepID=UPI0037A4590D